MPLRLNGSTSGYIEIAAPAVADNRSIDLVGALAAKSDYAMPKNAQTGTTYTFALADAGKLVTASNASASTYTVPPQSSVTWAADTILRVTNLGAGVVTFAGGAGVTVTNTAATLAQYASANLIRTGSDAWTVVPFSGTSKAIVSGTTGSPTITTVGARTVYKFTAASGSITFSHAGFANIEVLVAGGGGGSGAGTDGLGGEKGGAAGGGGGVFYGFVAVEAGAHAIAVGTAGTAGVYQGGNGGAGGTSSITLANSTERLPVVSASGGGGGGGANGPVGAQGNSHPATGTTNSLTGTSTVYGKGQSSASGTPPANVGQAAPGVGAYSAGIAGGSGVVIIAVG